MLYMDLDLILHIVILVDAARCAFMMDILDTHHGMPHTVRRESIYDDVIEIYTENLCDILVEFPFRIRYDNEKAIDTGGVSRDMFSSFWEEAYIKHFDGEKLLVPAVQPGMDMHVYSQLGTILSHGFMCCGYLPVRIAFPVIAAILKGPDVIIPERVLLESFIDFLSSHESSKLRAAIVESRTTLTPDMRASLIDILSRFECREMPTSENVQRLVLTVARHIFLGKPLGVLYCLKSGVPKPYNEFWSSYSVEKMFSLYKSLNATTTSVLALMDEPKDMNPAEQRIYNYLVSFVSSLKDDELRMFMRFVTGSSAMVAKPISLTFNHLTGLARRPISHTCGCSLELSLAYSTFPEFELEFSRVLSSEFSWIMDAI